MRNRATGVALAAGAAMLVAAAPAHAALGKLVTLTTPNGYATLGVGVAVDSAGRAVVLYGDDPDRGGGQPAVMRVAVRPKGGAFRLRPGDLSGAGAYAPSLAARGTTLLGSWLEPVGPATHVLAIRGAGGAFPGTAAEVTGPGQASADATQAAIGATPSVLWRYTGLGSTVAVSSFDAQDGWGPGIGWGVPSPVSQLDNPPRLLVARDIASVLASEPNGPGPQPLRLRRVGRTSFPATTTVANAVLDGYDGASDGSRIAVATIEEAGGKVLVRVRRTPTAAAVTVRSVAATAASVPWRHVVVGATTDGGVLVLWAERASVGGQVRVWGALSVRGRPFGAALPLSLPGEGAKTDQLAVRGLVGGGFVATWGRWDGREDLTEGVRVPAAGPVPRAAEDVFDGPTLWSTTIAQDGKGGALLAGNGRRYDADDPNHIGWMRAFVRRWAPDAADPPLKLEATRVVLGGGAVEDAISDPSFATYGFLSRAQQLRSWGSLALDVRRATVVGLRVRSVGCFVGDHIATPPAFCSGPARDIVRTDVRFARPGFRLVHLRPLLTGRVRVGFVYQIDALALIGGRAVKRSTQVSVDGPVGSGNAIVR